jgi:hypothetical protein
MEQPFRPTMASSYTVTIKTRAGTAITLTIPPISWEELFAQIRSLEVAELNVKEVEPAAAQAAIAQGIPMGTPAQRLPCITEEGRTTGELVPFKPPVPEESVAAQEKEVPDEEPADPRRSRFVTLF